MRLAIVVNLSGTTVSGGYLKYLEKMLPGLGTRVELDVYWPHQMGVLVPCGKCNHFSWPGSVKNLQSMIESRKYGAVYVPTSRALRTTTANVIMVQNMEPLVRPYLGNPPTECIRNFLRARATIQACRSADKIFAATNYVKTFLLEKLRIDQDIVRVIGFGVEKAPSRILLSRPSNIRSLERPFLFVCGSIRAYRGLEDAIGAVAVLKERQRDFSLLIAGDTCRGSGNYFTRMCRLARRLRVEDRVVWAGQLEAPDISWCLYNCSYYISTSRVESMSLPALEALSHGAVCVVGEVGPMKEVFGEAACYYDLGSVDSLASRILELESRSASANVKIRQKALRRSEFFSWNRCIENTYNELIHVYKQKGNGPKSMAL